MSKRPFYAPGVLALCLAAFLGGLFPGQAARAQQPVTVQLYDHLPNGKHIGYWAQVRAAGGTPSLVLVDSGSKGLMIMASSLGTDFKRTGRRVKQSFHDGTVFDGEIVQASLAVGGVATQAPITIMAVQTATCARDKPHCPAENFSKKPLAGIMGVGFGDQSPLDHPLASFGHTRSNGFIIRGGGRQSPSMLTMGLTDASRNGFTMYSMPKPKPGLKWRDAFFASNSVDGCVEAGLNPPFRQCGMILLDSGSSMSLLRTPDPVQAGPDGVIPAGTPLRVFISGQPEIRATSDEIPWSRRFVVSKDTVPRMILGGDIFTRFDVLYDLNRNALGLRPVQ